jgi:hypothetical protein
MKHLLSLLLAAFLIAGCAPATMQGLREQPGSQAAKFEVEQNYQAVYRTIVTNARKCWQTGMITAQMVVTADLYTDTKTGQISTALHGGLGVDTYLGIDIKALSDTRTEVTTYGVSAWSKVAKVVEQWVKDGHTDCGPRT